MINDIDLLTLLNDMESDRIERKEQVSDPDKIRQAICAFANDLPNHREPGVIFIGIKDRGGCANTPITDKLLLTLADMRSDGNILPLPQLTIEKRVLEGCEVAVVVVEPSEAPPVRYRGITWVRVGPRRAIATAEEERRLSEKRRARVLTFDASPIREASLNDLNLQLFEQVYLPSAVAPEILEQNQRSLEDKLTSLRFITPEGTPTVLGILTIGKEPRNFIPGAYIQVVRFDGNDLTDPIKYQTDINGPIIDQLRQLDEILKVNISTSLDLSASIEVQSPDFPIVALQQLTRNAIMHRSYEGSNAPIRIFWFLNHIEIYNPGGPYGQVNRENFGSPGLTDYRNPYLAEVLRNLGYVQRFGIGIALARQVMMKNGNPPLEYTVEDTNIMVLLRRIS
ncbi:MAG: ATP-binding protein [Bacteroidales bacterium]